MDTITPPPTASSTALATTTTGQGNQVYDEAALYRKIGQQFGEAQRSTPGFKRHRTRHGMPLITCLDTRMRNQMADFPTALQESLGSRWSDANAGTSGHRNSAASFQNVSCARSRACPTLEPSQLIIEFDIIPDQSENSASGIRNKGSHATLVMKYKEGRWEDSPAIDGSSEEKEDRGESQDRDEDEESEGSEGQEVWVKGQWTDTGYVERALI